MTQAAARSTESPFRYTASLANEIELRWQAEWEERKAFRAPNPGEPDFVASKPKFYCLDMFPYPSGAGLHVGHPEGYTATDIICRFKRMKGFNVLHPMGWDAFGLPAEQYAIQTGVHPATTTRRAIDTFRRQLKRFGFSYDWSREFATIDEAYYRWTQWIFLRLYESWFDADTCRARPIAELEHAFASGRRPARFNPDAHEIPEDLKPAARNWEDLTPGERRDILDSYRLAYLGEQTVNWCPKLGTALANEEVIDGRSERGGYPVLRKPLKQWMLRITALAQRLLDGLDEVDWPESTRTMQREWIGRSEGAEIEFPLHAGGPDARARSSDERPGSESRAARTLRVFTTRPDTIAGATYMVIAPEHPLADESMRRSPDVRAYVLAARNRSDVDRQGSHEKTGVFSGFHAVNPATREPIPIWIADYVLMTYGTGAIMAVPAHDERDFEFARAHALPIRDVVYQRPEAAMGYFARHATLDERHDDRWYVVLADFLGLVTTLNADPSAFAGVLNTVRTRRSGEGSETSACEIDPETGRLPEKAGGKRGTTRITWMDTLESMGLRSFDDLRIRFEHATLHDLQNGPFAGLGFAANSSFPASGLDLDTMPSAQAKQAAIAWIERTTLPDARPLGRRRVNFRLRDWLFSRQRYWGEPFPIVHDDEGRHHAVGALPVVLPEVEDYTPEESDEPRPLLAKARQWVETSAAAAGAPDLPPGARVHRETNTMPGWAGSCWYYLRYCDASNAGRFVGAEAERYWMGAGGVDLYVGGAEHAVLHLLYARFWHKVLFDLGEVSTNEPFRRLFHQGMITSFAYQRADKSLVPADEVAEACAAGGEEVAIGYVERATGAPVTQVIAKMSKSLKNVINPDDVIGEFGADTFRLYEMYMGPLDASKPWNPRDITGLFRFLQRAWRLIIDEATGDVRVAAAASPEIEKLLHRAIAKAAGDIEKLAFNTGIAALIEFVNAASSAGGGGGGGGSVGGGAGALTRDQARRFALVLSPFAPHMGEELWRRLGGEGLASLACWPAVDESMLRDDEVEIPVQIQGRVRARIRVPADADAAAIERLALADAKVAEVIAGRPVKKVVVVPGRMVNLVV